MVTFKERVKEMFWGKSTTNLVQLLCPSISTSELWTFHSRWKEESVWCLSQDEIGMHRKFLSSFYAEMWREKKLHLYIKGC